MEKWHEEYVELMFGANHTQETMEKAANIKYQHMPPLLYKYRAFNDKSISALKNDYLMSAPPNEFNDLFEGSLLINKERVFANIHKKVYDEIHKENTFFPEVNPCNSEELLDAIAKAFGGSIKDLEEHGAYYSLLQSLIRWGKLSLSENMDRIQYMCRNQYNVLCLSERNYSKLMWAHYADNAKGFCVGYDIKGLGMLDSTVACTMPVLYMDKPVMIVDDLDSLDGSQTMYMLSCKSLDWEYEKEWRIFYLPDEKPRPEKMPVPKEIYLGPKVGEDDKQTMIAICRDKSIPLYQMTVCLETQQFIPHAIL